jgi:ERO1-like protein alpha
MLCGVQPAATKSVIVVYLSPVLTSRAHLPQGEAAARIWNAIYTQSCFANIHANDTCTERRIFYRLVSGEQMHATTLSSSSRGCIHGAACVNSIGSQNTHCNICPCTAGMHASISAHIANDYLLDEFRGHWGANLGEFERRLGNPEVWLRLRKLFNHNSSKPLRPQ